MTKTNFFSVASRLRWLVAFSILAMLALVLIIMFSERALIMDERKASVQQAVETAYGVVEHYHAQSVRGEIAEDRAKDLAMKALKVLRYSEKEYFWINDMDAKIIMHPINPKLDGQDQTGNKDPNGKFIFVEFVNTVKKSNQGFVSYMWPKPGSANPVEKISFVKGMPAWNWVIGSGVYVDTVQSTFLKRLGLLIGVTFVLALSLGVFSFLTGRGILRQLGGEPSLLNTITQSMAQGNLAIHIPLKGEQESVMHSLQIMRDNIASIVTNVRQSSEYVANASAEIAQGNHNLSERTEQQASSLEETAVAMEELSNTVSLNAANVQKANKLAMNASDVAQQGGTVVAQVVENMKEINESSQKIANIIGVIDGIAFQTNILALNAAVEAARAGEQGRGFAVVASEVRNLAGRSAEAAKEIKNLINASVVSVTQGNLQAEKAGQSMENVVEAILLATNIMGEISIASNEQSIGVQQSGSAISKMEQDTQMNAALVEEMAAAATNLNSLADDLVTSVSVFNLSKHTNN